jgi:8-oxo-dGTP diphosphatase
MSQRRPDQSFPLCWEFPGGKVEPGEPPEAALAREIREELGCEVKVGPLFDEVSYAYEVFDLRMLVYDCALTAGTPTPVQVAAIAWFPARDLPTLKLPPADYPLARRLSQLGALGESGRGREP